MAVFVGLTDPDPFQKNFPVLYFLLKALSMAIGTDSHRNALRNKAEKFESKGRLPRG